MEEKIFVDNESLLFDPDLGELLTVAHAGEFVSTASKAVLTAYPSRVRRSGSVFPSLSVDMSTILLRRFEVDSCSAGEPDEEDKFSGVLRVSLGSLTASCGERKVDA